MAHSQVFTGNLIEKSKQRFALLFLMEEEENLFPLFHKYNKLVRRQMVKPLSCGCGGPQTTTLGEADELVLTCFACGAITTPGLDTIDTVRAVVSEHFMEKD